MREVHTYLGGIGLHLSFLASTGNEVRGLELIERHLPWMAMSHTPGDRAHFASAAVNVLRRLSGNGYGDQAVAGGPDWPSTVDGLAAALRECALELAARFDARNGTDRQSRLAEERMSEPRLVEGRVRLTVLPSGTKKMVDAVLEMRGKASADAVLSAAEEAVAALERVGESEELWRARVLLWELYSADHRHRDAALELLDLLLGNENLPDRAAMAERGARMVWGDKAVARYRVAADLHRQEGNALAELRMLRGAIQSGGPLELLERADSIEDESPGPSWLEERSQLHTAAANALWRSGRLEAALERAQAAREPDAWLVCSLLLELGRAEEAEALARKAEAHEKLVLALRALGRHDEADAVMREQDMDEDDLY